MSPSEAGEAGIDEARGVPGARATAGDAAAGSRGRAALAASEGATGGENEFLPIRTRFFDDVLRAAADRLDQVVLLGAGLDTRAFRLAIPAHVRWFEIDSAWLFDEKERLLAELGAEARCQRTVVAADLTAAWSMPLLDSGFQGGCRTAWIAEGLLFYLSADAVRDVLAEARRLRQCWPRRWTILNTR